jgi:hypothetical protein
LEHPPALDIDLGVVFDLIYLLTGTPSAVEPHCDPSLALV